MINAVLLTHASYVLRVFTRIYHHENPLNASVLLCAHCPHHHRPLSHLQKAMFHFQKLLERNPTHYSALYKLILLLKRAGKLTDAPRFIKLAERSLPRAENDPGFKFCKVWITCVTVLVCACLHVSVSSRHIDVMFLCMPFLCRCVFVYLPDRL